MLSWNFNSRKLGDQKWWSFQEKIFLNLIEQKKYVSGNISNHTAKMQTP